VALVNLLEHLFFFRTDAKIFCFIRGMKPNLDIHDRTLKVKQDQISPNEYTASDKENRNILRVRLTLIRAIFDCSEK